MTVDNFLKSGAAVAESEGDNTYAIIEKVARELSASISSQLFGSGKANKAVPPPVDFSRMIEMLWRSVWHAKSVDLISRTAAGTEPTIKPKVIGDEPSGRDEVEAFVNNVNGESWNIVELARCTFADLTALGNGYVEVTRTNGGAISELWHLPGVAMRVGRAGGFWLVGRKETGLWGSKFYKNFGDTRRMNSVTGKPFTDEDDPDDPPATEVLHFKNYFPGALTYGVPWWIASSQAQDSDWAAGEHNADLFRNKTIPRGILVLRGHQPEDEVANEFRDYFKVKQQGQNHRMMIIGLIDESHSVDWIPIEMEQAEAGFLTFRAANRDEIVAAHGVPPRMLGIRAIADRGSGATEGEIGRRDFKSFVIEPLQTMFERVVNDVLFPLMGFGDWRLKLTDFDLSDHQFSLLKAKEQRSLVGAGIITANEARVAIGMAPSTEPNMNRIYITTSAGPLYIDGKGGGVELQTPPASEQSDAEAEGVATGESGRPRNR